QGSPLWPFPVSVRADSVSPRHISAERNRAAGRLSLAGVPEPTAVVARCGWEVCMRSVSFLAAAAVIGLSALTAASGQQAAGPAAAGSPGTGAPPVAACGSATPTSPPHRILTLGTAARGGAFRRTPGAGELLYPPGPP